MTATAVLVLTASIPAPTSLPPSPAGVTFRSIDGGPAYFSQWPGTLPSDPSFFPVGVWLEGVHEPAHIDLDRAAGLNTYVGIVRDSDLDLVERAGMHVLAQADEWLGVSHPAIDGWLVSDEADMMFRPGWDDWDGEWEWSSCVPPQDDGGQCGYTVQQRITDSLPDDGLPRFSNYGKGVIIWGSDDEAELFVNRFQDFVSSDVYWFTDNNECPPGSDPGCRSGASYGRQVDRLRTLDAIDGQRQPVWAFVEVGHPFTEDDFPTIEPAQVRSAVWHSIIAGARGIIYFNHSFGGPCETQHALREPCYAEVRATVAAVDQQIAELAPVLNAPFADGYVSVDGGVRAMAKRGPDGTWYVFAGSRQTDAQEATVTIAAGTSVQVLFEARTIAVTGGRFTDTFADENAVHVYRITG